MDKNNLNITEWLKKKTEKYIHSDVQNEYLQLMPLAVL
jgi:hypothetical protein